MSAKGNARVAPFPWGSLEALSRQGVEAAARMRRLARHHAHAESVAASLSELVGEPVEILVRRVRQADAPRGADDAVGVLLTARESGHRVLVEVEGSLAASIVAKALRQRAPKVVDASKSASPTLAGAVAAILVSCLRRGASAAPRVLAAGPGAALARDLVSTESHVTTAWLTILVGADAFEARVSVPDDVAVSALRREDGAADSTSTREALVALGEAPLSIPLVVCEALALRSAVAALAEGDAFVPAKLALSLGPGENLVGRVALVPARAERGIGAHLAEDGRLVVRELVEEHPWEPPARSSGAPEEAVMAESNSMATNDTSTMEVLDDVPVVVRVELGSVELTARKWAELAPGDVVSLGRKVGAPAILRVGGVEIAQGELVQVDGEYGVRILKRLGEGR